jgi:hypothetical protein
MLGELNARSWIICMKVDMASYQHQQVVPLLSSFRHHTRNLKEHAK